MVDALLWMYVLFSTLNAKLLGFENVKDLYDKDVDFSQVYKIYEDSVFNKF